MKEAHKRDLRVITGWSLITHPISIPRFQRARNSKPAVAIATSTSGVIPLTNIPMPASSFRTLNLPTGPGTGWHRRITGIAFSHQPDLNFENPEVHEMVIPGAQFLAENGSEWAASGCHPHLYEAEGTNCENLPQTHEFLKNCVPM